jgi:transcriptional regulator with GAF, ATPase, and Fis domain
MEESTLHIVFTKNQAVLEILSRIEKITSSDCNLLLIGETGVDKQVFDKHTHRTSNRCNYSLIVDLLSVFLFIKFYSGINN